MFDFIAAKRKLGEVFSTVGVLATALGLVIFPSEMVAAAKSGVELCFNVIIPSLFPFFVVSALVVKLGLAQRLGVLLAPVMRPVFNVNGACASALILGFVGGYPVGAKTVIALYKSGGCSRTEAERMLAFCNNSGPAFILGVVGAGIFSSAKVGFILYLAHAAASLAVGFLFRFWKKSDAGSRRPPSPPEKTGFAEAFVEAAGSGFSSCLGICGFVIFFTVLLRLLFLSGIMGAVSTRLGELLHFCGFDKLWAERLLTGVIELTSGVWSLREAADQLTASMSMAAFMLGWAGISVYCQVLSFIGDSGLSAGTYLIGKLLHGVFSAIITVFISRLVTFDAPVADYLAQQVTDIAAISFPRAMTVSAASAGGLCLIFAGVYYFSSKRGRKSRRNTV